MCCVCGRKLVLCEEQLWLQSSCSTAGAPMVGRTFGAVTSKPDGFLDGQQTWYLQDLLVGRQLGVDDTRMCSNFSFCVLGGKRSSPCQEVGRASTLRIRARPLKGNPFAAACRGSTPHPQVTP